MNKFFIVGCPRSGTTVLQQALNRHSQIVIPPETKFFYSLVGQSRSRQRTHLQRLQRDLKIELDLPNSPLREPTASRACFDEMARRYLRRLGREQVTCFGDKTPEHAGHLPRILEVLPEAKIIFLYRDGRDVALSLSRMPWVHCDVYVGMMVWLHYYRVLADCLRTAAPNMYFLRYEDLATHPEEQLDGVLRFLDLPYERPVALGSGNREGIPDRELGWKSRALEPIRPDRIGAWRDELSEVQVGRLERLGGRALASLGYEASAAPPRSMTPGFAARLLWGLSRFALRLPYHYLANELRTTVRTRIGGPGPIIAETGTGADRPDRSQSPFPLASSRFQRG